MEEILAAPEAAAPKAYKQRGGTGSVAVPMRDIETGDQVYVSSGLAELDRVLGGGIVEGSLLLVGGEPGSANPLCCCRCATRCAGPESGCCMSAAKKAHGKSSCGRSAWARPKAI